MINGLDDFSTKIQENFDDSVKELKTNLDKQAEIINNAINNAPCGIRWSGVVALN